MGRDRAARRRDALTPPHGGRSPLAQGRRDRARHRGGSRRGARTRRRPPRHQALERLPHDGRPREDPRLRNRDVRGAHPGTGTTGGRSHGFALHRRHGRVPFARTDPEKARGRTQRRLLAGMRDLRDGHRPARLSRRDRAGCHRRHAPLGARRPGGPRSGDSRGPSPPDRAVPRKESRKTLSVRGRSRFRAQGRADRSGRGTAFKSQHDARHGTRFSASPGTPEHPRGRGPRRDRNGRRGRDRRRAFSRPHPPRRVRLRGRPSVRERHGDRGRRLPLGRHHGEPDQQRVARSGHSRPRADDRLQISRRAGPAQGRPGPLGGRGRHRDASGGRGRTSWYRPSSCA